MVADCAGDLYNKDAIIQFLLPDEVSSIDKNEADAFIQGRVKALRDVVEVQFEVEHDDKTGSDKWVCPVTRKELGPNVKAVFLVPCGHAFSHEAIKEMKSNECVECGQVYDSQRDAVPLLPSSDTDKAFVIDRMQTLQGLGLSHSLKKASGSKKRKAKDGALKDGAEPEKYPQTSKSNQSRITDAHPTAQHSSIKNSATANVTAKVLDQEARKKQRIAAGNENIQSLYSKSNGNATYKNGDFMTRGFSIPANAKHK